MTLVTLKLSDVIVGDRLRTEHGDLEELAESIRDHGLLHPPVVNQNGELIAGGRRYAALCLLRDGKVESENPQNWEFSEFTLFDNMTPAEQKLLEIEENVKRKDLSWHEKVLGIADYHRLGQRELSSEGERWTQQMTGKLLGFTQAHVSNALEVAKELRNKESPFWKCSSLTEALQVKAKERLDYASKILLERVNARKAAINAKVAEGVKATGRPLTASEVVNAEERVSASPRTGKITKDDVAGFYYRGSCLEVLPVLAKTHVINHIICDPPYGINMDYLGAGDETRERLVERVAGEHQVEDNIKLLDAFLKTSYDCIAEDGFLCMWYDLDHHTFIADRAKAVGWKVCRWPLVWCKTSTCLNQAAQYNITKATEVCYILRRSERSIIKTKQGKNWLTAGAAASSSHPFTKPHDVWRYLIETVSTEGQTICDPFAGEGSALASIFKMKRIPVGIEINEQHIANGLSYIEEQLNDPFADLISNATIL